MSKRRKRNDVLVGVGEWLVDTNDYIACVELIICLEQAPFWNEQYAKMIELLRYGEMQENIANELRVSQSTVSRMLKQIRDYLRVSYV